MTELQPWTAVQQSDVLLAQVVERLDRLEPLRRKACALPAAAQCARRSPLGELHLPRTYEKAGSRPASTLTLRN